MNNPTQDSNTPNNASTPSMPQMNIPGGTSYGRPPYNPAGIGGYAASGHAGYSPYGAGRKLIIGEGITMSGEIEHCDHLLVEGAVQATLKDAKMLDISETGVFYGTVEIEEGTIAGRFEGDMNVAGRLTVKATGVINGSVTYKELVVEAGATIEGKLTPTNSKAASSDKIATADFSKGKMAAKGRDSKGSELPFSDKASGGAA